MKNLYKYTYGSGTGRRYQLGNLTNPESRHPNLIRIMNFLV